MGLSPSVYYYRPQIKQQDQLIRDSLKELSKLHSTWGFWKLFNRLSNEGKEWNHKRVHRIYKEMGLNMKSKTRKRIPPREKEAIVQPLWPNLNWSMDFMHDGYAGGKHLRTFNVIDDFNRESLNITVDTNINANRVIREMERLIEWRGKPEKLRVDNGPEFIASKMQRWCDDHNIALVFIEPGKPSQNALIERFNRTFRTEVLDLFQFETLEEVRQITRAWMWEYNNKRPHDSLGGLTPVGFLLKYGYRHNPNPARATISTFQQDDDCSWKSLISSVTN